MVVNRQFADSPKVAARTPVLLHIRSVSVTTLPSLTDDKLCVLPQPSPRPPRPLRRNMNYSGQQLRLLLASPTRQPMPRSEWRDLVGIGLERRHQKFSRSSRAEARKFYQEVFVDGERNADGDSNKSTGRGSQANDSGRDSRPCATSLTRTDDGIAAADGTA